MHTLITHTLITHTKYTHTHAHKTHTHTNDTHTDYAHSRDRWPRLVWFRWSEFKRGLPLRPCVWSGGVRRVPHAQGSVQHKYLHLIRIIVVYVLACWLVYVSVCMFCDLCVGRGSSVPALCSRYFNIERSWHCVTSLQHIKIMTWHEMFWRHYISK